MGLQLSSFPSPLSDEQSLIDRQAAIRARLAASRRPLHWQGQGGITLYGEAFGAADAKRAVLLVCGRVESCIKYDELSDELVQLGFAVYRFDHRGQGLSGRLLTAHHKGHIRQLCRRRCRFSANLRQHPPASPPTVFARALDGGLYQRATAAKNHGARD